MTEGARSLQGTCIVHKLLEYIPLSAFPTPVSNVLNTNFHTMAVTQHHSNVSMLVAV